MNAETRFPKPPASFEMFLDEFAAAFVRAPAPDVDAEVVTWLQRLVEFMDADRSSLAEFTAGGFVVTHSWARPGYQLMTGDREHRYPALVASLRRGEAFVVASPGDIPEDAPLELRLAQEQSIQSHVSVPLMLSGSAIGGLGIACMRKARNWSPEDLARLRLIGTVFANALARKRAIQEYRDLSRTLEHAGRVAAIGQLASSFAHEVKQPLGASLTNAQTALRLLDAPQPDLAEIRAALEDIAADNRRASDIVNELRRFLRRQEPSFTKIGVVELLDAVVRFVSPEARNQGVEIAIEVADGVTGVFADRVQVQQVFVNLLLNAFDALAAKPAGQRRVELSAAPAPGRRVAISVRDSGPGVSPDLRARLFEPFVTTKPHGLGIGLAISQTLLLAHGDGLTYADAPGGGAVFSFMLPADPEPTHGG